ncbi:MAG: tetratricopeptide repeat protein [Gemmatimonadaceae bacterium]|nr:tetratricopeptide repeat protein [Gemmatimonadaceae bacterium]
MNLLDLAKQHRKAGRLAESAATLQQAVMAAPMDPEVWFQGGTLAIKLKEFAFARTLFEMCARLVPTDAQAIYNVGYCSFRLGDPEAALAAYERAVAIDPGFVRAHIARGQLHYILGHPDEGRDAFDVALALPRPANAGDLELRALVRVTRGEFADGWADFDESWAQARSQSLESIGAWDGRPDPDVTVCLTVDGGFGDTLLFIRYAAQVRARVGRVVAALEPALVPLLEHVEGIDAIVRDPSELHSGMRVAGLWTLPRKLGTTRESIPSAIPYIPLPTDGPRLAPTDRLRVGLVWFGGRDCAHDFDRSCHDVTRLAPLLAVDGVDWHLLQPGVPPDAVPLPPGTESTAHALPPVRHFGDTAFILRQLDLVITVDTAVANLSAALGIPTWIMIPTIPEFRWPIGADRSPWYPAARLFRRAHTRDWSAVGDALAVQLRERLAAGVDADLPDYRRLLVP